MSQLRESVASDHQPTKLNIKLVKDRKINFWWLLGIPSFCFVVGLILDRTPPQYLPIIELCLPISFGVLLITLFLVFSSNVIQIRTSRADRRLLVTKLFEGLSILTDKLISPFLAHFLLPLFGSIFTILAFRNRPTSLSTQSSTLSTSFLVKVLVFVSRLVLAFYGALVIGFVSVGVLLWRREHFLLSFISQITLREEHFSFLISLLTILITSLCLLCRTTPFTYSLFLSFLPLNPILKILTQITHIQFSSFTFVWSTISLLLPTLGLSFTLKSELKTQKLRWKSLSEIKTQWQAKQKDHSKLRNDLEKLNQELQTLQTQLHDKDEFLVRLIQELRTIVNNETGNIELLLETTLSSQQEECAVALEKSVTLITNLINNVLYYLRAESGGIVLNEMGVFSIDRLLDRILSSDRLILRDEIDLYYEIDPEVPMELQGDENVLEVIVDHLVENAVKFTHNGEICVHVQSTKLTSDEVLLKIEVRDTGIGIHHEDLPHLKKPFFVVNDTGVSGSGLGIPICDKLTRLFKRGRLDITSQINKGSVVTFQGVFRNSSTKNQNFDSLSITNIELLNVLILDDNPRVGKAITNLLKRQGLERVSSVVSTTDAENILTNAQKNENSIVLLLLDYFMQGPTGKKIFGSEFARTLKVEMEMKNVKIIAMISRSQKRYLTSPYIDGYLFKPIKIRQVMNIVKKVMLQSPLLTTLESKLWLSGSEDSSRRGSYESNDSNGPVSENNELKSVSCLSKSRERPQREPLESAQINSMLKSTHISNNVSQHTQTNSHDTLSHSSLRSTTETLFVDDGNAVSLQQKTNSLVQETNSHQNTHTLSTTTNKEKKLMVLIAEDNPLNQQVVKNLIQKLGHTCVTVNNGEEVVQEYKRFPKYDLILMDCRMPVMNGYDATIQIRNFEQKEGLRHTPIIALTAADNLDTKSHCLSVGMDHCLIKPINKATLERVLNTWTKNRPQTDIPDSNENWILLVEDNPVNAKITKSILEKQLWNVDIAIHGKQALDMVLANYDKYNVILMDIYMPVMDGLTCTSQIRQYERDHGLNPKPIIALTANSMNSHRIECLQVGCTEFLVKPIDPPTLVELMTKYSKQSNKDR